MLKIYRTYIRSKLDYGSPVYTLAAVTPTDMLNTVLTDALRVSTGAFKSTPTDNFRILANEMKLLHTDHRRNYLNLRSYRRNYLNLGYFCQAKNNTNNTATQHVRSLCYQTLFRNKAIFQPLSPRIQQRIEKYQLKNSLYTHYSLTRS